MSKEEGEKGPSVVVVVLRPSVCPVVRPVDVVRPLSVRPRPSVVVVRPLSVRPVRPVRPSRGPDGNITIYMGASLLFR